MDIQSLLKTLKKSPIYGNPNLGKDFDDSLTAVKSGFPNPEGVIIRRGGIIDNLAFSYKKGFTAAHGGFGGSEYKTLLAEDEYIVKVAGTVGKYNGEAAVETLTFTTNKGTVISAGSYNYGSDSFEYKVDPGYAICALFGRADHYLNAIGFYSKKLDLDIKNSFLGNF